MERLNSGDSRIIFGTILCDLNIGLMKMWKSTMAKGGGNRKRFQYCTDPPRQEILCLRALQSHSGCNLIDPSLHDNVLIPNDFFEYIIYIGCAINLHSITNSGLIPGGQNFEQQTDTIISACGSCEQRTQRSGDNSPGGTASCMVLVENVKEMSKHCVLGRQQTCSKEKLFSSIKDD